MSAGTIQIIGKVLCAGCGVALLMWLAVTLGFFPGLDDQDCQTGRDAYKKHCPPWWQRFSCWFLPIVLALLIGSWYVSGFPPIPQRPTLWQQFGRGK